MTEFSEDNLTDSAAALTYYAVLSIFPALLAMISIVGLVGDPQTIIKTLTDVVSSIGPASAVDTFKGPIEGLTKSSGTAGIMLIVGIAAALWTASGYVGAFMRASNVIYEVEEGRSFIKLRPLQMLVTLVLVVLLALVLVAVVLTGPIASAVGSAVGLGGTAVTVWNIAKWPVLFAVVVFMITLLYYASPNAKLGGLKSIVPGSALAIVVWLVASAAFAFYVANFGSYNKTYGALGGVIDLPRLAVDHEHRDPARRGAERRARAQPPARGTAPRGRARAPARGALGAEAEEARADRVGAQRANASAFARAHASKVRGGRPSSSGAVGRTVELVDQPVDEEREEGIDVGLGHLRLELAARLRIRPAVPAQVAPQDAPEDLDLLLGQQRLGAAEAIGHAGVAALGEREGGDGADVGGVDRRDRRRSRTGRGRHRPTRAAAPTAGRCS